VRPRTYDLGVRPPEHDVDWVALTAAALPVQEALEFVASPSCGAVVLFLGTVRDHSEGRPDVSLVQYEAWDEQVEPVLRKVVSGARERYADVGRVAVLHRTGELAVGDVSVAVAVSAPHRADAFDAGRYCIDTLKETAPIWKLERWDGGEAFGLDAHPIRTLP
jgi:molybdopterin synthase catalytic subunit